MNITKEAFDAGFLTLRQYDCLYYLIKGMTAKQTAKMLNITDRTVHGHLNLLRQKFNCHRRSDLVSRALKVTHIKNKILLDLKNEI